eukprot:tig00021094_g18096.t1
MRSGSTVALGFSALEGASRLPRGADALLAFLPHDLRRPPPDAGPSPAAADASAGASCVTKRSCCVLLVDVSGFSRLEADAYEICAGEPSRAAAALASLLNAFFTPLLAEAERFGADVATFAGDASLLVLEPAGDEAPAATAARAVALASRLFAAAEAKAKDLQAAIPGSPPVSLHVGMGFGTVVAVCAGPAGLRRYVCTGPAVEEACCAEPDALPGQLVCGAQAMEALGSSYEGTTLGSGNYLIPPDALSAARAVPVPTTSPVWDLPSPWVRVEPAAFVPKRVADAFRSGLGEWIDETRTASVVFVSVTGILSSDAAALDRNSRRRLPRAPSAREEATGSVALSLHAALTVFEAACAEYGAQLNKLVVDDKGCVAVLVLGLPPLVHVDDGARAVSAAVAMRKDLHSAGFGSSAGIATGRVFAGCVGGAGGLRCEYTVLGRTVNLAARLMQQAGGSVLVDAATHEAAGGAAFFDPPQQLALKGFSDAVTAFRAHAATKSGRRFELPALPLFAPVGRREELALAVARLARPQGGGAVLVRGRAGAGKSTFVRMASDRLRRCGFVLFSCSGVPEQREHPYWAWRETLQTILAEWLAPLRSGHAATAGGSHRPRASGAGLAALTSGGGPAPGDPPYAESNASESRADSDARLDPEEVQDAIVHRLVPLGSAALSVAGVLPLLNAVVPGFGLPETDATRGMDAESRARAVRRLVVLVLKAYVHELAMKHSVRSRAPVCRYPSFTSEGAGSTSGEDYEGGPAEAESPWRPRSARSLPPSARGAGHLRPLLVVDHLDWTDGPSLDIAIEAAASGDFAVLAAVRTDEGERQAPHTAAACRRLLALPRAAAVDLLALDGSDSDELARSVLGVERLGPALTHLLKEQALGNPLVIVEMVEALRASNLLSRFSVPGPEGRRHSLAELVDADSSGDDTPRQFSYFVVSRVSLLPFHTQLLLKVAAVCGTRVPLSTLCAVYPQQRYASPAAIRALLANDAVRSIGFARARAPHAIGKGTACGDEEEDEEEGEFEYADDFEGERAALGLGLGPGAGEDEGEPDPVFEWRHERIQQAVRELLPPAQRCRLHRATAEYLERLEEEDRAAEAAEGGAEREADGRSSSGASRLRWGDRDVLLSHHWLEAGEQARALPYMLRHAARAAAVFDNATACEVLRGVLSTVAEIEAEGEAAPPPAGGEELLGAKRAANAGLGHALVQQPMPGARPAGAGTAGGGAPAPRGGGGAAGRPLRRGPAGLLALHAALLTAVAHRVRERLFGPYVAPRPRPAPPPEEDECGDGPPGACFGSPEGVHWGDPDGPHPPPILLPPGPPSSSGLAARRRSSASAAVLPLNSPFLRPRSGSTGSNPGELLSTPARPRRGSFRVDEFVLGRRRSSCGSGAGGGGGGSGSQTPLRGDLEWEAAVGPLIDAVLHAPAVPAATHFHRDSAAAGIATFFSLFEVCFLHNDTLPALWCAVRALNDAESGRVRPLLSVCYSAVAVVLAGVPLRAARRLHDYFERKALEHARDSAATHRARALCELGFARALRGQFNRSRRLQEAARGQARSLEDGHRLDQLAAQAFLSAFLQGDFARAEREASAPARSVQGRVWQPAHGILAHCAAGGGGGRTGGRPRGRGGPRRPRRAPAGGGGGGGGGGRPLVGANADVARRGVRGPLARGRTPLLLLLLLCRPAAGGAAELRRRALEALGRAAALARPVPYPCMSALFIFRIHAALAGCSLALNGHTHGSEGGGGEGPLEAAGALLASSAACRATLPVVVPLLHFAAGVHSIARGDLRGAERAWRLCRKADRSLGLEVNAARAAVLLRLFRGRPPGPAAVGGGGGGGVGLAAALEGGAGREPQPAGPSEEERALFPRGSPGGSRAWRPPAPAPATPRRGPSRPASGEEGSHAPP